MAQAIQGLSSAMAGHSLSSSLGRSKQEYSCGPILSSGRYPRAISQLDNQTINAAPSSDRPRRDFLIATTTSLTAAAAALFVIRPESAYAGKRAPPPPPKDKNEDEEKGLSAYDAKLLASQRRKDGMKELLEKQKKKAKSAIQRIEDSTTDIFDQGSEDIEG